MSMKACVETGDECAENDLEEDEAEQEARDATMARERRASAL